MQHAHAFHAQRSQLLRIVLSTLTYHETEVADQPCLLRRCRSGAAQHRAPRPDHDHAERSARERRQLQHAGLQRQHWSWCQLCSATDRARSAGCQPGGLPIGELWHLTAVCSELPAGPAFAALQLLCVQSLTVTPGVQGWIPGQRANLAGNYIEGLAGGLPPGLRTEFGS